MKLLKATVNLSRRTATICSVIFCMLFVLISPVFAEGAWVGGWDVLANLESPIFSPNDLAVDSNRTVYAIDVVNSRVWKKGLTDTLWTTLPNQPFIQNSEFLEELVVGPNNSIYVLKAGNWNERGVWKFDPSNNSWTDLTASKNTVFYDATGIAVDTLGNVYVSEMANVLNCGTSCARIRKLAVNTTTWTTIGDWNTGGTEAFFQYKNYIATDINNNLYAVEAVNYGTNPFARFRRLASGATSWTYYLNNATYFDLLKVPNDIAVDRFGNVYVTDNSTKELHVFAKNDTQWAQIRKDGNVKFINIQSVAVDNKGYVYVSDSATATTDANKRILRHQPWATQLVWDTQPTGKPALQALSPSPVLSLKGPDGDQITGVNSNWAIVSLKVPAGATLGGTTAVMFNDGKATFSDLNVNMAGTYKMTGQSGIASTNNIVRATGAFPDVDLIKDSSDFTITAPIKAVTPTANPVSGATVLNNSSIALASTTSGAHFHYTTNGDTPTGSSPTGNQVLLKTLGGTSMTVKAIASAAAYADSDVATFTYTITYQLSLPLITR